MKRSGQRGAIWVVGAILGLAVALVAARPAHAAAKDPPRAVAPAPAMAVEARPTAAVAPRPAPRPVVKPDAGLAKLTTGELIIGTKPAPPFSFQKADGTWAGISIELWRRIAKDLKLKFRFVKTDLEGLISGPQQGKLDAGVAALTITAKREQAIDFTHPFFSSGLGIAVSAKQEAGMMSYLKRIFTPAMVKVLLVLFIGLIGVGVLVWLLERRRNTEEFGAEGAAGVGAGLWWSAVTMTTVGYGDKSPITLAGRLVAVFWMFASIVIISFFTAAITTTLTVGQLESKINGPEDLHKFKVGSQKASTSSGWLDSEGIAYKGYANLDQALSALRKGKVDAVVYDAPILRFKVKKKHVGALRVLPRTFQRQDYGISLPNGSPLREPVNRLLLELTSDSWFKTLTRRYLGR